MANAADTLERAYELIETGNVGSARNLLDTIREDQSENPDFWWVYAHAVEDKVEGIDALDKLKALDPDYPGIAMLYREMELGSVPGNDNDTSGPNHVRETVSVAKPIQDKRSSRVIPLAIGFVVILIVVVAGISLLSNQTPETPVAPTVINTDIPVIAESTEAIVENSDTQSVSADIEDVIRNAGSISVNGTREEVTSLGNTMIISLCALPGPATSTAVSSVWTTLLEADYEPADNVDAIAFTSTDCVTTSEFAMIGIPISLYQEYRTGTLSLSELIQNHIRLN